MMLGACRRQAGSVLRRSTPVGASSSFLWFSSAPPADKELVTGSPEEVQAAIAAHGVVVFSKTWCGFCGKVKKLFANSLSVPFTTYELDEMPNGDAVQASLLQLTGQRSVPNVFVGGHHIGGCDDTFAALRDGSLQERLDKL